MVSVEDALKQILETIQPLPLEQIPLPAALGRVLGEDVVSGRDIPPNDNSSMDGYALRAEDTAGASHSAPLTLRVIEDVPAGYLPKTKVKAGEAIRIMTGAPIPEGADAVLQVELTERAGDDVRIFVSLNARDNIRFAGEDVKKGDSVIARGNIIRPAEAGMLAALGRPFICVYRRPVVAIFATGDELLEIDEPLSPGKIVNSNSYALTAQVLECGGIPLNLGIAKDTKEDLTAKFRAALHADVIISSGGVSVGDYDFVKDVIIELGSDMKFWRVAMRPGRPFAYGTLGGKPLFALPGNPVSSMVSFEQFVRPALLKMMGHRDLFRRSVQAVLKETVSDKGGFRYFLRAHVRLEDGRYTVTTTGEQGSGILNSMVLANGLLVIPPNLSRLEKGDMVTVQLIDHSLDTAPTPGYI